MVEAGFRRSFIHGFVITFLTLFAIRQMIPCLV